MYAYMTEFKRRPCWILEHYDQSQENKDKSRYRMTAGNYWRMLRIWSTKRNQDLSKWARAG